jgi:hypothetical protein
MRWSGILGLCGFLMAASFAARAGATSLPDDDALQALAEKPQWAHLLHYRLHPLKGRHLSQNDSPEFFLAADGKEDPAAELKADLNAFLQTNQADDESAQCQFPARYHWLKQQLPDVAFTDQRCPAFEEWRDELDAHALTLIFPASHINSPSSMYGHTLVRMDRADDSRSKLLAYSVNFAANADPTDNELVFSYKGLSGGYPGVVSVMPYYVKTNEYQHMEYRDVWEYRLNFSKAEVDQFVRHIWETKDTYYDYFFFDENCSYRLLALLDASSERADLAEAFTYKAVPVDTIRALWQNDLVENTEYRPSAASDMEFKSTQVNDDVLAAAQALVDSDEDIESLIAGLNAQDQVRALELSHAYARYLAIKKKQANPVLRKRTLALLSARAKRPATADFADVPMPVVRDDQGHLTSRAGLWGGQVSASGETQAYSDLSWRIAYHDVLDLPSGFVPGSQIQMGQWDLRVWEDEGVKLQRFKVVDVLSLSHQTYFQRPVAWAVTAGAERFLGAEAELHGYLKVAFGRAYQTALGRWYGLAETQLLADNQFEDGYQLSFGPRVGWLLQHEQVQAQVEANWQPLNTGDDTVRRSLRAEGGYALGQNLQLRLKAERQLFATDAGTAGVSEVSAGMQWYF